MNKPQTIETNVDQDYSGEKADLYHGMVSSHPAHKWVARYSILVDLDFKGKSVLDLACGGGSYLKMVLKHGAGPLVGVDLSADQIRVCKSKNTAGNKIQYRVGNASEPTIHKPGPFDFVMCNFGICYSPDVKTVQGFMHNIALNLKTGGTAIVANTEGCLPASNRDLYKDKFDVEYALMQKKTIPFDSVYCTFPGGWTADYFYVPAQQIEACAIKAGLVPKRRGITFNPNHIYSPDPWTSNDLSLLANTAPYKLWTFQKKVTALSLL